MGGKKSGSLYREFLLHGREKVDRYIDSFYFMGGKNWFVVAIVRYINGSSYREVYEGYIREKRRETGLSSLYRDVH